MMVKKSRLFVTIAVLLASVGLPSASQSSPPASPPSAPISQLRIVHGPVLEDVGDTTAIIAWSTNTNAGTVLRYGIDPEHLDSSSGMPWGGFTHRVELRDLKPGTKYFFRAESPHGQGTGEDVQSAVMSFQTRSGKDPD